MVMVMDIGCSLYYTSGIFTFVRENGLMEVDSRPQKNSGLLLAGA